MFTGRPVLLTDVCGELFGLLGGVCGELYVFNDACGGLSVVNRCIWGASMQLVDIYGVLCAVGRCLESSFWTANSCLWNSLCVNRSSFVLL